jgi:hypothetical protein
VLGVEVLGVEVLGVEVLGVEVLGVEVLGIELLGDLGSGGKGPRGDSAGSLAFSRVLDAELLVEGTPPLLAVAATQVPARGRGRCSSAGGCLALVVSLPDWLSSDDASVLLSSLGAFISMRED